MNTPPVELGQLAVDRTESKPARSVRRRWLTRYAVPMGILLGFVGLLAAALGDQWFPRPSVSVMPVIVKRGEVRSAGTPLFQAAGWIEPRPTPVAVSALRSGVIESLLVVEGQPVEADEPVARLIAIDAELAVHQAKAALALREGELRQIEAELTAARQRRDKPIHLRTQLSEAQSRLAKAITEADKLPFLIEAANGALEFAEITLAKRQSAGSAVPESSLREAARDAVTARAALDELRARGPNLEREIVALRENVSALAEQLTLLIDETRAVAEAEARQSAAIARREEARLRLQEAELALERTVVRAPMTGRILRLVAFPGQRVTGLSSNADSAEGTGQGVIAEMYDPERLQVRADVRLEDVRRVVPGAPVRIETASAADVIAGRVLRSTSSANVQKNTLEVKVELISPPATVSPEMLVAATFLAPETPGAESTSTQPERIFVPESLVQSNRGENAVWLVDSAGIATMRQVTLGGTGEDGLVEIVSGLNPTDKLIVDGAEALRPGVKVTIRDENAIGDERD